MPWKDQLNRLKGDWDKFNAEHNILPGNKTQQQQPQQQQYYPQQQQQPQQDLQQNQYNRPPPPPPGAQAGAPPFQAQSQAFPQQPQFQQKQQQVQQLPNIYWQPNFDPSIPISQDWDAKLGAGGWGNNELQNYTNTPQNSFQTPDHKLIVRATAQNNNPDPGRKYTSARLVSRQTLGRDRGVLSAVLTSPCASGIWPAFWLLPHEPFNWPSDGEVDIMESWNNNLTNKSCLHWGHFDGADWNKHITQSTHLPDMPSRPVRYDFAWDQPGGAPGQGRMIWYIDGRPVMKAPVPGGTRPLREFTVLLNVAMGGNVNAGAIPRDGSYDLVVHWMAMMGELEGGFGRFEADWNGAPNGVVG